MLIIHFAHAQIAPPCAVPPPPGAEACQTACVYCDFNGYMGINNGSPSGGNTVCGAISLHNDQWFGFVAGSDFISIDILTSNCQDGNGLQAAFFDACDAESIVCNPGVSGGGGSPLNISYGGFVPGQTYFLMIDGWSNDVCNFEIQVIAGSITPPAPGQPEPPIGPQQVCPGAVATYSIDEVPGAGYYRWRAPAGASINGGSNVVTLPAPDGNTIEVVFGNLGGQICVEVGNACFAPVTSCINVVNQPIPPTVKPAITVCFEDLPFFWDESPNTPINNAGTYNLSSIPYDSYLGCDSIVRQTIVVKSQPVSNIGTQFICAGQYFEINNNKYYNAGGPFTEKFENVDGCDSLVRFTVFMVPINAQIAPVTIINCANPVLTLNGNGSTTGPNVGYAWYNPVGNQIGNLLTQNIAQPGTFSLVVTNSSGNAVCRDTATISVAGDTTAPGVTAVGGILGCTTSNQSVQLQASSQTSGLQYQWVGPGITSGNDNLPNPVVDVAGNYTVVVTNPVNSCTSTSAAAVIADNLPPTTTTTGGTITCNEPTVLVDVVSNAPNAQFTWNGPGVLPGQETFQNPEVNAAGIYGVTVTNPTNGCTRADSAAVTLNTALPSVSAGTDQVINCNAASATLNGTGNANGATFTYLWNGPGITPANQTLANPTVNIAGNYVLRVTNTLNGCNLTDTVVVDLNVQPPNAVAGPDFTLTCTVTSVQFNSAGSSNGAGFTALWTGPGINPANQNQYNPVVDQPGTYTIQITNSVNGCTTTDNLMVASDIAAPTADAGTDMILTCSTPGGISLNGSGSPANIEYFWSGPGIGANNETQQTPTVTQPGPYTLQVTNTANGCTNVDEVDVAQDANLPSADAGVDLTLTCLVSSVDFDGSGSTIGPDITYLWTGPGITPANQTQQSPQGISLPGTYGLTITNITNNCVNTDVLVVDIDTLAPNADAGADLVLNCFNGATDTLRAVASDTGPNFNLLWSGPGITPATQNLPEAEVNLPGVYTVLITNVQTQCTATASTSVSEDLAPPTADAGTDQVIDCVVTSSVIGGNSSTGPEIIYLWTGPDINPANEFLATPVVSIDGIYDLLVTDFNNGCIALDQVSVISNAVFPTAVAGPDGIINCNNALYALNASTSSNGPGFQLTWEGPGINAGDQNDPNANVDQAGVYVATVINTGNSCATSDTVIVALDVTPPVANAGANHIINCVKTDAVLDGSGSSAGAAFTYFWSGLGVQPGTETQQSPVVTVADTYTLLVTNNDNGCTALAQVTVVVDNTPPNASAGADIILTCQENSKPIDGSSSTSGAGITYTWDGPGINGNNFNQQNPMVADSGLYVVTVTNTANSCTASDAVYVALDADYPLTEAGPDRTINCIADTVQLDGSMSATGPGITMEWSGGSIVQGEQFGMTPRVYAPAQYILTVTNANNGCSNTDFVNVEEDVFAPIADAGADQVITCSTTSGVVISAADSDTGVGFNILWAGPDINAGNQNTIEPVVSLPGTYTVMITKAGNGCISTDSVVVSLSQDLPVANAGDDQTLSCAVLAVLLDASASTPAGLLDYAWSGPDINVNNQNSVNPEVTLPGAYALTVTNTSTGCTKIDVVNVQLDNALPQLTLTGDTIDCTSPLGALSVSSSLSGTTFVWTGPGIDLSNQNLDQLLVDEPGVYIATGTAPNGCQSSEAISIGIDANVPQGAVEGTILNCSNNGFNTISAEIFTAGATGAWSGPNGFTSDSLIIGVTQPGMYVFTITSVNGCSKTLEADVIGNFTPPLVSANAPTLLDCNTTSMTLSSVGTSTGPNFSYAWTTADGNIVSGANTTSPTVDQPGTYNFIVTNLLNGCKDSTNVLVEYDPSVPTAFELDVQNINCTGDEDGHIIVLGVDGGTQPFVYTLNGVPANVGVFENLGNDDYLLSLQDANGCLLDTLISISEPGQLAVELGPDQEIQMGESVTVEALVAFTTPLASVTWLPAAPCDTTCLQYTHQPLTSYIQNIELVDINGCTVTDRLTVIVKKERLVYVPNVFNPDSNFPDNNTLQIFAGTGVTRIVTWHIFDRWGGMVHQVDNFLPGDPSAAWDGNLNGEISDNDVYVWFAEIEFIDGEIIQFNGDVTLIR